MDIKEMLLSGETADSLLEQFKAQLEKAQNEIAAEQEKEDDVKEARWILVDALINYLIAIKVVDEDELDDEDYDSLYESIKAVDEDYAKFCKLF